MAGSTRDHLAIAVTVLRKVADTASAEAEQLRETAGQESAEAAEQRAAEAEQAYDAAAAVESVTARRGWMLLKNTEETRGETSNLPVSVSELLRDAVKAQAAEFGAVLAALAEEAYTKVLEEGWVPAEAPPGPDGTRGAKKNLNLRVDDALRQQVRAKLPELSLKAGYKVSEAHLVLSHICDELGIERAGSFSTERLRTRIPAVEKEHFDQAAAAAGVSLAEIVEDGIRELLAGAWVPEQHPYMADASSRPRTVDGKSVWASPSGREWTEWERVQFNLHLDPGLLASLRSKCESLSRELGFLVFPGSAARQILTRRLGNPE